MHPAISLFLARARIADLHDQTRRNVLARTASRARRRVHTAGRLSESLDHALAVLRRSDVIPPGMGPMLYDAFTAVRAAEAETFHGQDPDTIAAAHRWLY